MSMIKVLVFRLIGRLTHFGSDFTEGVSFLRNFSTFKPKISAFFSILTLCLFYNFNLKIYAFQKINVLLRRFLDKKAKI